MSKQLFGGEAGSLSISDLRAPDLTFITLQASDGDVISASAPVESIQIGMHLDSAVSKSLGGDYLISEFGYQPINITVSGINLCSVYAYNARNATSIQQFYSRHNINKDIHERILVGMSGGQAFKCVLLNLDTVTSNGIMNIIGAGTYTLTMLGVKL